MLRAAVSSSLRRALVGRTGCEPLAKLRHAEGVVHPKNCFSWGLEAGHRWRPGGSFKRRLDGFIDCSGKLHVGEIIVGDVT
jgi:hypothetical protein